MRSIAGIGIPILFTCAFGVFCCSPVSYAQNSAQAASLPSETPEKLVPVTDSFDYVKRDVMIPMRDGVKLHTVIVIPKDAKNAPILLTRTPYNASGHVGHADSSHLAPILNGYDNALDVIVEG